MKTASESSLSSQSARKCHPLHYEVRWPAFPRLHPDFLRSLGTGCLEKVAQSPCEGRQLARVVTICGKAHLRVFASQAVLLVAGLSVAEYHMCPHLGIRYADKGIPCYTPRPFVTQANPSTRALRLELPRMAPPLALALILLLIGYLIRRDGSSSAPPLTRSLDTDLLVAHKRVTTAFSMARERPQICGPGPSRGESDRPGRLWRAYSRRHSRPRASQRSDSLAREDQSLDRHFLSL